MQTRPLLLAGLLLLSVGDRCRSPLEAGIDARFVLQSIDAVPVPAVWAEQEEAVVEILADTLWLRTDRSGVRKVSYRSTEGPEQGILKFELEEDFSYSHVNGHVEISFDCRDVIIRTAMCVAPPHMVGAMSDGGMTLVAFDTKRMRYRRI